MELYGGGMVGKSNNYQLGGRIAGARRSREYQGEMRELERKQRDAARRKKKSGFLGSLGAIAGGALGAALAPVTGGASLALATGLGAGLGKAAGESSYGREDYSGGKYAQDTRGELREVEDDYRKGIGERALVTGLQAAVMPGVYEKVGQVAGQGASFLKGIPEALEAGQEMGLSKMQALGDYAKSMRPSTDLGSTLSGALGGAADPKARAAEIVGSWGGYVGQTPKLYAGSRPDVAFSPQEFNLENFGDMALSDMNIPETQLSNLTMADLPSRTSFDSYRALGGYGPFPAGGFAGGGMIPKMQAGGGIFGGGPVFGPGTDWSMQGSNLFGLPNPGRGPQMTGTGGTFNPSAGYGTATGAMGALKQMGMGDIANDPRLQKYLEDLPQFSMGYEQKVGDYRTGAQQGLLGLAQAGASGAGGFAGSGAATTQSQQQRQQMVDQFGRQRRGVVEGYQADVLSAIGDIERKGEFEFGMSAKDYEQTEGAMAKLRQQPGMLGKLFSNVGDEKLRQMLQSSQG